MLLLHCGFILGSASESLLASCSCCGFAIAVAFSTANFCFLIHIISQMLLMYGICSILLDLVGCVPVVHDFGEQTQIDCCGDVQSVYQSTDDSCCIGIVSHS